MTNAMQVTLIVTLHIDNSADGRDLTPNDAAQHARNTIAEAMRVAIDRKLVYGVSLERITTASTKSIA